MDPISAICNVLQLIKVVWAAVQWMRKVHEQVLNGDLTLRSISIECHIYGASIKTIGQWLKQNHQTPGLKRQVQTTHNAITLVKCSMQNLYLDLKKMQTGKKPSNKDKTLPKELLRVKLLQQSYSLAVKRQWFQETMHLHLAELRAHTATLHLTLSVIELTKHDLSYKENVAESVTQKTEVLQAKTTRLERKLLLRKFITKALEIKRLEIAQITGQADSPDLLDQPVNVPSPSIPQQNTTKKLTFYDVVQLARHQAAAEKARSQVSDLIDLSEAPVPDLDAAREYDFKTSHDLLDLGNALATEASDFPSAHWSELDAFHGNEITQVKDSQPSMGRMEARWSSASLEQKNPEVSELPVTGASDNKMRSAGSGVLIAELETGYSPSKEVPITAVHRKDQAQPELVELDINDDGAMMASKPTSSGVGGDLIGRNIASIQSSATPLTVSSDLLSESAERSLPSTAAPSIFSHSSSLSSTSSSSSAITVDEVRKRNSIATPTSILRSPKAMSPLPEEGSVVQTSIPMPQDASMRNQDSDLLLQLQPIKSEDHGSVNDTLSPPDNIDEPDIKGYPWLVQAARDGDEDMVRRLLGSGANINAQHKTTHRSALSEAAIQNHTSTVELLIENGSAIDDADFEGYTALHHASQKGHLEVAKKLLKNDANVDISGLRGQTPLHLAMRNSHQSLVMLLIQKSANVNARDDAAQTPLHIGAGKGNLAMCSHLLEEGAQIDSREAQSRTPLQFACEGGYCELVQAFLRKSTLLPSSMTFLSAFFGAVEAGQVRVAECFFPFGLVLQNLRKDIFKPITLAAKSGSPTMVDLMIREDCDVNAKDEKSWNALHFASYYGHNQAAERLIAGNVSLDAVTSKQQTPLLLAVKGSHFAVTERLLRANNDKALVGARDELSEQAVHLAARNGSLDILNLLSSNDAKFNAENSFGWQPIHIACAYGHLALVERILQQGSSIEEKIGTPAMKRNQTHKLVEDGYWAEARWPYPGSRPLHLACEYGHSEIARYLIAFGAKTESACGEGWTPLHHAAFIGSPDLVGMLLGAGVNPHAMTNEGRTAQSLQFCTGGTPILDHDKTRISALLSEAMERTRKQKSFKVALKKVSSVEEKNNLVRAVTYSMTNLSKSHAQRPAHTSRVSDPPSRTSYTLSSSSRRPNMPHLPFTSPLPRLNRTFTAGLSRTSDSQSTGPKNEVWSPSTIVKETVKAQDADRSTEQALVPVNEKAQSPAPETSTQTLSTVTLTATRKSVDEQASEDAPVSALKHRSATINFSRLKPGLDAGKFGLGGIGKQTTEIGKQGFIMGKQGLDMGSRGFDVGKSGIQKAAKFAMKGKIVGRGKGKGKGDASESGKVGEKAEDVPQEKDGGNEKMSVMGENQTEGDNDDDDNKSEFSVGEFAEYGTSDFKI